MKKIKSKEEALSKDLGEIDYYKNLKSELDSITDKNGKIQKGYEKRADYQ